MATTTTDPLAPENLFPEMYGRMRSNLGLLEPVVPSRSVASQVKYLVYDRWATGQQTHALRKALEATYLKSQRRAMEAAEQDATIAPVHDYYASSGGTQGVRDVTGPSFADLRALVSGCEPVACIVNTRVGQVSAFAQTAEFQHGRPKTPGFRIRMTHKEQPATDDDKARIAELTQYILETGYCAPPEDEAPVGWEPGFDFFLKQLVRDRLTLDWVAVRRWESAVDPKKFPVVSFACVDAGVIRRAKKNVIGVQNHRLVTEPYEAERTNVKEGKIKYVELEYEGGRKIAEYTADEMFCARARPRTDAKANGYGFSEAEEAYKAISGWISSRDYNLFRFDKDSLPRGVLTLLASMNQQHFDSFQMMWKQMFQGNSKRWNIPILRGTPQAGSGVTWTPFDLSNREMEYSQFLFTVAIWVHSIYQIHPDETGFSASSPFRPPLSEASPQSDLEQSQDKGLTPLLTWIAGVINRNILWVIDPSRRYTFEFVGLGHWDEALDTTSAGARLNSGLSTPRMEWAWRDQKIPDAIKDLPAWDLPMTFAAGMQLLQGMQQAQQQQDMAEQQQQEQLHQQTLMAHNAGQAPGQDDDEDGDDGTPRGVPPGVMRPAEPPRMQKALTFPFDTIRIEGLPK